MKHAGPDALARIAPLLAELRRREALSETRPGCFALKSRAFLHFHDDPSGIFADVRLAGDFVRMPVTSSSAREQSTRVVSISRIASARRGGARVAHRAIHQASAHHVPEQQDARQGYQRRQ